MFQTVILGGDGRCILGPVKMAVVSGNCKRLFEEGNRDYLDRMLCTVFCTVEGGQVMHCMRTGEGISSQSPAQVWINHFLIVFIAVFVVSSFPSIQSIKCVPNVQSIKLVAKV